MVAEQAIGKSIGDGRDVFAVELHEVVVVAVLAENILAVIAAIVDVVILARFEWCEFLHLLGPDRTGLQDSSGLNHALAAAYGFRVALLRAIPDPTYLAFNDLFFSAERAI